MSDYPTLDQMGVKSVENVVKYSLRQEGDTDVLKIYYKRPKGSFLSRSKKFTFVRPNRVVSAYSATSERENPNKLSPMLLDALRELKILLSEKESDNPVDPKEKFLADLDHLERVMNAKINEIRQQIRDLEK